MCNIYDQMVSREIFWSNQEEHPLKSKKYFKSMYDDTQSKSTLKIKVGTPSVQSTISQRFIKCQEFAIQNPQICWWIRIRIKDPPILLVDCYP